MTKINYSIFDRTGICQMREKKHHFFPRELINPGWVSTWLFQWTDACKFLNNTGSIWNIDPQSKAELSYSELWGTVQQDWLKYKKKEQESNQSVFMGEMHNLAAKLKAILNPGWFFLCPVHKYQPNCLMSTVVVQFFNLQSSPEAQALVFGRKLWKTWRTTSSMETTTFHGSQCLQRCNTSYPSFSTMTFLHRWRKH